MLETLILDNTERLLGGSPYLNMQEATYDIMHLALVASQTAYTPGSYFIYNDVLDCFLINSGEATAPIYRWTPDNFNTAGATIRATDSSLGLKHFAIEYPSGRTWAVLSASGGVDGLYRRDASVATPNWTRVVGATNGATLYIYRKTNGDLWYHDSTAGNWYLLADGAAGGATTSAPSNLYATVNQGPIYGNVDFFGGYRWASPSIEYTCYDPTEGSVLWDATAISTQYNRPDVVYDNAANPNTNSVIKCFLPRETGRADWHSNQVAMPTASGSRRIISLGQTYSLFATVAALGPAPTAVTIPSEAPGSRVVVGLTLLNKVTWEARYLGRVALPFAGAPGNNLPKVGGARLKDNKIGLMLMGALAVVNITDKYGAAFLQIPLNKLDI